MRLMQGFGLILGGLAGAGGLATLAPAGVTATSVPVAALSRMTATQSASLPAVGNPAGHVVVPVAGRAVSTSHPNHVVGHGTAASCTSAAVVKAVAEGGIITFNCGPRLVTIRMKATAKVVNTSHRVVLDGGGKVTLSGGGKIRILYMNTCDPKQIYTTTDCFGQQWPQLVVQNLTLRNAYAGVRQTPASHYGGGAIFDEGGQLKVVNSAFISDRCYQYGPDLGGAAIRALGVYAGSPVYITHDTFTRNSCSNGGALSGLGAHFDVFNSLMTDNRATGFGANPTASGTPGGGSGGAIYTDGDHYNLGIHGTVIRGNTAREGGSAIFFVVDAGGGSLRITYSTLHNKKSGEFQNAPGIFDEVDGKETGPVVIHSSIS